MLRGIRTIGEVTQIGIDVKHLALTVLNVEDESTLFGLDR
jgi:hypothetical protein